MFLTNALRVLGYQCTLLRMTLSQQEIASVLTSWPGLFFNQNSRLSCLHAASYVYQLATLSTSNRMIKFINSNFTVHKFWIQIRLMNFDILVTLYGLVPYKTK